MCKHGTTVQMPINALVCDIDQCISHIVAALNAGGIQTTASCCGHGHCPGNIMLKDGRSLVICKSQDLADQLVKDFPDNQGGNGLTEQHDGEV